MRTTFYTLRISLLFIGLLAAYGLRAQDIVGEYKPEGKRILFVLDGSGSMVEQWEGRSKFEIAKNMLVQIADSLSLVHPNVEFGVRVFGHQSPRAAEDCKDSKLEVPFGKNNGAQIKSTLDKITPQGHTPIAYSLRLAAEDFTRDMISTNAVILITDGLENCGGNPCAVAKMYQEKRIALKPYIIGLNLNEEDIIDFDCVGYYYDAKDQETFDKVVNIVISQALNNTTAQINLLDEWGNNTVTNLPVTLYDSYSKEIMYNFIHSLDEENGPDTLHLDPVGSYDLQVHSIPPVWKKGIELAPGKHNIIAVKVPVGDLDIAIEKESKPQSIQTIVKEAASPNILYMQDMGYTEHYLEANYDLEVLSLPRTTTKYFRIDAHEQQDLTIPKAGKLNIVLKETGYLSLYTVDDDYQLHMFWENEEAKAGDQLELQPGEYIAVYRSNKVKDADFTKTQKFTIESGEGTSVKF